jgi:hypothetical protein
MILKVSGDNRLLSVLGSAAVYCAVGTECLYTIKIDLKLQTVKEN